jgi:hypothetical protein
MKFHPPWLAVAALSALFLTGCEPDTVWSPDSKMLALDPHGMLLTYDVAAKKFQQGSPFSFTPRRPTRTAKFNPSS